MSSQRTRRVADRTEAVAIKPRLLRPADAATYVGLSSGTLANMRVRGDGPPFRKIAGRVVYEVEDLDAWIEQHPRVASTSADA